MNLRCTISRQHLLSSALCICLTSFGCDDGSSDYNPKDAQGTAKAGANDGAPWGDGASGDRHGSAGSTPEAAGGLSAGGADASTTGNGGADGANLGGAGGASSSAGGAGGSTASAGGAAGTGGIGNTGGGGGPERPTDAGTALDGGATLDCSDGSSIDVGPSDYDSGESGADAAFCTNALAFAVTQYAGFRTTYTNPTSIPRSASLAGAVSTVGTGDWTSGFVAGSYWYLYEFTNDPVWRTAAESFTSALYGQRTNTGTHDVGFMINNSYGNGYRLTHQTSYVDVLETAASSLSSRFSATVGCTRSWNGQHFQVIVDNMMNLELLFRATALGGSATFRQQAITHALTTMANHFRADHSSYHLVDYDPNTGAVLAKKTVQGLADESAWARGQAWGLYGYTMAYRETGDDRFLTQAQQIADFYTQSSRMPLDCVPYFDFDAPVRPDVTDYRDASAGAIAASALLELSTFAPVQAAERYRAFAMCALRSLSSADYRAALGTNAGFLLKHSVGNYPGGSEIDVAINYADYYYLEALMRCSKLR